MVIYPAHVARNGYRGRDPRKSKKAYEENQIAAEMERKINEMLLKQEEPISTYLWHEIADLTGFSYETVKKLGYSIDGGSNGFTAIKPGMTMDEALEASKRA